ncbi:MAG: 50S ribosomal protein L19, partial [Caldilineaceae bacterium]|nr:50S ribosomal protein L19 [Caldilineaceae bacterium]
RRAKLYYLRELRGKSARIAEAGNARARKLNDAAREEAAAAAAARKAEAEAAKAAAAAASAE